MKRIGKIIYINPVDRSGQILDENDQEIPFNPSSQKKTFLLSDDVQFTIELTDKGLVAVNLTAV